VSIPAFHYEVAMAGGDTIPCAEYASFGTQELADNALAALTDRKACLLANHGQIALGESIRSAMRMARMIETLAKQYILSMQLGRPVLLDGEEMLLNVEKFKTYGKQGD
jgi:L-fuculose-phosphate aldolase